MKQPRGNVPGRGMLISGYSESLRGGHIKGKKIKMGLIVSADDKICAKRGGHRGIPGEKGGKGE